MKRAISGYFDNAIMITNLNGYPNKPSKSKKLVQSTSEKCVSTQDFKIKENPIYLSNRQKFNDKFRINNIDIKFNLKKNLKKFDTIINNKSHSKLGKTKQGNNQYFPKYKNARIHLKSLNNVPSIPKLIIIKDNINKSIKNKFDNKIFTELYNENNKQTQLDPHGYFPEDFSLNIFKSTELYKKRYKIEPCRLKKVLKNLNIKENSKKNKNIISLIKKNTLNNNVGTKMFKLLKSNKIDRFVNRYLNLNNASSHFRNENEKNKENNKEYKKESNKENNKENNLSFSFKKKKTKKIFITHKNNEIKKLNKLNHIESEESKLNRRVNIYTRHYTNINNNNCEIKRKNYYHFYRNFSNRYFSNDSVKINTANSGTQTININDSNNIKNSAINLNDFTNDSFNEKKNKKNIVNKKNMHNLPSYKEKYCSYKEIKFEMIKNPKESYFLKKFKKMMKSVSNAKIAKTNSSFSNDINNKNKKNTQNFKHTINNLQKGKKLIFSFYDPKDRFIQFFKKLEKKSNNYQKTFIK